MKVFYRPEQSAPNLDSFSPSADKPRLVVDDWTRRGLLDPSDIQSFERVTRADLKLAHDPDFVDGVLDLELENGFGNTDPGVASSLVWTTGSLLGAARYALEKSQVTCSPTSGFHHAHYGRAGGYCTFNGLMVTALKLRRESAIRRISIIDCDVHFGDGTQSIIRKLGLDWVDHQTMGWKFQERADVGADGKRFFAWLLQAVKRAQMADIVLYQAGADPHVDDPLGGLLTTEQMHRRDAIVFNSLRDRPVVWNLAGGYQTDSTGGISPVLDLHRQTFEIAARSMALEAALD